MRRCVRSEPDRPFGDGCLLAVFFHEDSGASVWFLYRLMKPVRSSLHISEREFMMGLSQEPGSTDVRMA